MKGTNNAEFGASMETESNSLRISRELKEKEKQISSSRFEPIVVFVLESNLLGEELITSMEKQEQEQEREREENKTTINQ
jgi:hypothetical protein